MKKIGWPDIVAGIFTLLWEGTSTFILFQQWNTLEKTDVFVLVFFMFLVPLIFWGKEIKKLLEKEN
ncbi:MAG TPA: hypothetical protein VJB09_02445 [Candidatus Paceibacterota bacterium]